MEEVTFELSWEEARKKLFQEKESVGWEVVSMGNSEESVQQEVIDDIERKGGSMAGQLRTVEKNVIYPVNADSVFAVLWPGIAMNGGFIPKLVQKI